MALSGIAQIFETLNQARGILIITKERYSLDDVAAALAFSRFLKKYNKEARLVVSGLAPAALPSFLQFEKIDASLDRLNSFLVSVKLDRAKLDELTYDIKDDQLFLRLVPQEGTWSKEDVTVGGSAYRYDLIVCLGAPDIDSLGLIALKNPDFFHNTPVINIDCDSTNERFGAINVIDLAATSVSEVTFKLLSEIDRTSVDAAMATAFLTGVISKTRSFRTPKVTPSTLDVASQLMALGGERERIVGELFRTHSIPTLKLWGRALSRLQHDARLGLAWASLTREDFMVTGGSDGALHGVLEELLNTAADSRIAILFYETFDQKIQAIVHAEPTIDLKILLALFKPEIHQAKHRITFTEEHLLRAEEALLGHIRQKLEKEK